MKHLLVAAFPDAGAREAIHGYRLRAGRPPGYHLASSERLHMTICELGEVEDGRVGLVHHILARHRLERSELLVRVPRGPGLVRELTVRVPRPFLKAFREPMCQDLVAAGFYPRGGERPHITLAYDHEATRPAVPGPDIPWVLTEFRLVWSLQPAPGVIPRHTVLQSYPAVPPAQGRLFD